MCGLLIHWWELGWRVLCLGLLDVELAQALPVMAYVVQQCTATTDWTVKNRPSAAHSLCVLTAAAAAAAAATAATKASRATNKIESAAESACGIHIFSCALLQVPAQRRQQGSQQGRRSRARRVRVMMFVHVPCRRCQRTGAAAWCTCWTLWPRRRRC